MMARQSLRTAAGALYLICLCALTSCSLLSSDQSSPQTNGNTEISSTDAQKAVDDARSQIVPQDDLNKAKAEGDTARATADKLKDKADKMKAATLKDHKDPENPDEAPKTYNAIQEYKKADEDAQNKQQRFTGLFNQDQKARRELEQANAALATARQRETSNSRKTSRTEGDKSKTDSKTDSIVPSLPVILGAVGGVIVLGLLFWLTWRKINNGFAGTEDLILGLAKKQDVQEVKNALSGLKEIKTQLTTVQEEVALLSQRVQTAPQEQPSGANAPTPASPSNYNPPVEVQEEEVAQLPTSANTFLARLSGQAPIIKPDPVKGLLVTDPDGDGHLVLVQDQHVPGGLFYIVPRITRFQTKEEFYNHYEQYYDCNRPADGEVWLHKLAVVDKVDGGWRLRYKGLLEIK